MSNEQNWQIGVSTHPGPVKRKNEDDAFFQSVLDVEGNECVIVAIADGMGGYENGATASKTAITLLEHWWKKHVRKQLRKKNTFQNMLEKLTLLLEHINQELLTFGSKSGTTLSILILYKGNYAILHVGDSRIYQLSGSHIGFQNFFRYKVRSQAHHNLALQTTEALETELELVQLTEDHSWVEQQVRKGVLSKEEARHHPKRNMLTQCLGVKKGISPFQQLGTYQSNDLFLLCSDGFYAMFSEEEMIETLSALEKEYSDLQKMSEYLVNMANFSGTKDNITVILLRHPYVKEPRKEQEKQSLFFSLFNKKKWS